MKAVERLAFGVIVALLLVWAVIVAVMPGMIDEEKTPAAFGRFGITNR